MGSSMNRAVIPFVYGVDLAPSAMGIEDRAVSLEAHIVEEFRKKNEEECQALEKMYKIYEG